MAPKNPGDEIRRKPQIWQKSAPTKLPGSTPGSIPRIVQARLGGWYTPVIAVFGIMYRVRVPSHPPLYRELGVSLGYRRPCLKNKITKGLHVPR